MTYNTELQSNNTDLQSLIDKASALPDKVNIDAELATQDSLISQIATALEGKSSSGIETCTVKITVNGSEIGEVIYTTVENNIPVAKSQTVGAALTIIVLCGSSLVLNESLARVSHTLVGVEDLVGEDNLAYISTGAIRKLRITAAAGETASIEVLTGSGGSE